MVYKIRADLTGQVFGLLTALEPRGATSAGHAVWLFRCACGVETEKPAYSVKSGNTKSCGCASNRLKSEGKTVHGVANKGVYGSYRSMLNRCLNPKNAMFHRYGGRGISVDERWLGEQGPANFYADMGDKPTPQHTLERRDNDGPYSKENCEWATRKQQATNRTTTKFVTVDGTTLPQSGWDAALGAGQNVVGDRIRRGWDKVDAATTPTKPHSRLLTHNGTTLSMNAWEAVLGFGHGAVSYRIDKLGWSVEKALTHPSRRKR